MQLSKSAYPELTFSCLGSYYIIYLLEFAYIPTNLGRHTNTAFSNHVNNPSCVKIKSINLSFLFVRCPPKTDYHQCASELLCPRFHQIFGIIKRYAISATKILLCSVAHMIHVLPPCKARFQTNTYQTIPEYWYRYLMPNNFSFKNRSCLCKHTLNILAACTSPVVFLSR